MTRWHRWTDCNPVCFSVSAPDHANSGRGREAMPYVEATGAKLYFEESGYGYPIIFIHEFASDICGWESQTRYFSVATVASPTMPQATHPAISRRISPHMVGRSRWTTSPL